MKIVVTDGYALNPGDLSWDAVASLGELTVYERTPVDLVVERCKDADVILTNKTPISKESLGQLNKLRLVSVLATGYNIVDVQAARERNVTVCNVPAYGTASVAQHTFALILELFNHVGKNAASVAAGNWVTAKDYSYTEKPITGLAGKTLGIVGFGNIGQQTARIGIAFGMSILYYSAHKKEDITWAQYVALQQLFKDSDVVSLHCPLTKDNERFVNKRLLRSMKPSSVLINTARGQLIDEADLTNALNNNIIAGAGLDVLSAEPPSTANPLLAARNCLITPHTAWIAKEARQKMMDVTTQNIKAFINDNPMNVVN